MKNNVFKFVKSKMKINFFSPYNKTMRIYFILLAINLKNSRKPEILTRGPYVYHVTLCPFNPLSTK